MFKPYNTDMASCAHEELYDLIELDNTAQRIGMRKEAEDPSAVRNVTPAMIDSVMNMRENIHDKMKAWLISVIAQDKSTEDIIHLDAVYDNMFSKTGLLQEAVDESNQKFGYNLSL